MALEPARTVADLEELRALTGDENGAQRVAWTDTWEQARAFLRSKVEGMTRWPTGRFFQVGEKTSLTEAQDWAKRNGFAS